MTPRRNHSRPLAAAKRPSVRIEIDPANNDAQRLWRTIGRLASELKDIDGWCLVGGMMVQLFAYEHSQAARPTTDVDVLADARERPSRTEVVAAKLKDLGAVVPEPKGLNRETGYGFELDGALVEVLAPDGLRRAARTIGKLETIEIPGGTQALRNTEVVEIVVAGGRPVRVRRPTLPAALLLKSRAVTVHHRPDDQLRDVVQLLGLIKDPRAVREGLTSQQGSWLTNVARRLDFDHPIWRERFSAAHVQRARGAIALLTDQQAR